MQERIVCTNCHKEITNPEDLFSRDSSGSITHFHKNCAIRLGLYHSQENDNKYNLKGLMKYQKVKELFKNRWKLITVIGAVILLIFLGINYNDNKQYALNVAEADQLFDEDKLSDAIDHYNLALQYKNNNITQDKLALTNKMKVSSDNFNDALNCFNNETYLKAYNEFKDVIPEDIKRYEIAQTKMIESKNLYIDSEFADASNSFSNKDYRTALIYINAILLIDSQNQRANQLQGEYQNALDEQNEIKRKEAEIAQQKADNERKLAEDTAIAEEKAKYNPQTIVNSNGKKLIKFYMETSGLFTFSGKYSGNGNFIVEILNSNQDLEELIANEIGSYVIEGKSVYLSSGFHYLEVITTDGSSSWTYSGMYNK